MKKYLFVMLMIAGTIAVLQQSCKKDKDDDEDPTPVVPVNVICDGNGTTDYFPLALSNSWYYNGSGSNDFTSSISTTEVHGGQTYFVVTSTLGGTDYLRKAANGDIIEYRSGSGTEVLLIPGSPTVNQSWAYTSLSVTTRKVISINATLTTDDCSYTGLLKIQEFDASEVGHAVYYYKKGVGMISTDQIWPGYIQSDLATVTLH